LKSWLFQHVFDKRKLRELAKNDMKPPENRDHYCPGNKPKL
jgi:hypothetical protein